jgi:hypothetical protein
MIVIGETNSGKTTLLSQVLYKRPYVVVFVTKTFDDSFDRKRWPGYTLMREWNGYKAAQAERVLLWPKHGKTIPETRELQRTVFEEAFNRIYLERGWTVVVDETQWMVDELKLGTAVKTFQHQARSSGITNVSGVQRPSHIPVITYGSATHAYVSRQTEDSDVKRLAALGGVDSNLLRDTLPLIPPRHWLYLSKVATTGPILTKVDLLR